MSCKILGALAVAATLLAPGVAQAASAIATANVNMRAGPSTGYPVVGVVGSGHGLRVLGCLGDRSWCDVSYAGQRGWISSNYLAFAERGRRYSGSGAVAALRAPVITFSFGSDRDDRHRGRRFHRDRDHGERRDVREARKEMREERRELRRARRELRHERRKGDNLSDERREVREERRELSEARRRFRHERRDWRH